MLRWEWTAGVGALLVLALALVACNPGQEAGNLMPTAAAVATRAARLAPTLTAASTLIPGAQATLAAAGTTAAGATFTDPFAYCRAVGTIDEPDARYTGEKVPDSIARGLQRAFNIPASEPLDRWKTTSVWRCMNGKVYACNIGANIPCLGKAETTRMPNEGMLTYCRQNPNADNIPAVAAGRTTIYEWRCRSGTPEIIRQTAQVDERDFIANFWYEIPPS